MRPWRHDRTVEQPKEPAETKMTNTALGVAIGPGVGLSLGMVLWGAQGISLGLAIGAGIGVVVGAALDGAARSRRER